MSGTIRPSQSANLSVLCTRNSLHTSCDGPYGSNEVDDLGFHARRVVRAAEAWVGAGGEAN